MIAVRTVVIRSVLLQGERRWFDSFSTGADYLAEYWFVFGFGQACACSRLL